MADKEVQTNPTDLFGQAIDIGDFVIGGHGHGLAIYKVTKITPKMIRIVNVKARTNSAKKGQLRYCNELAKIEETLVTFYLMKS